MESGSGFVQNPWGLAQIPTKAPGRERADLVQQVLNQYRGVTQETRTLDPKIRRKWNEELTSQRLRFSLSMDQYRAIIREVFESDPLAFEDVSRYLSLPNLKKAVATLHFGIKPAEDPEDDDYQLYH